MTDRRKATQISPVEKLDGQLATEDKDKAEILNEHFAKQSISESLKDLPSPTVLNAPDLSDIDH